MFSSRLFWKIFLVYAALSLVWAGFFVAILSERLQGVVIEQVRQRLHDSAVVLRSHMGGVFDSGQIGPVQETLKKLGRENETRMTLVAESGIVVGDSDEDPAVMDNHHDRDELLQARRTGTGVSQRTSPTLGIPMMYYALRVGGSEDPSGFVRVSMPMDSVNEQVGSVQRLVWGTAALISLAALVLTYGIVGRIIRPLSTLTRAAQAVAGGNLNQSVDVPNNDELGMLGTAFNSMTSELAARIEQLQGKQEELQENSDLLATVLSTMVEGVVAVDRRQQILFANEASRRLLDFAPGESIGRPIWEAARNPKIQDVVESVLEKVPQQRIEFELPRTQSVVALVARRLPGDPCPGAVLVFHDMTELRRLENVRRDFASNVSHELKTPLTTIKACTETLLEGAIDDPDHNRVFLQRIEEQADRLHAQILDLLSLARIESGQPASEVHPVALGETIRDCLEARTAIAESTGVSLSSFPGSEICVLAEKEGIRTILDNLVENAINYTPAGGSVTLRWTSGGKWARIEVADTGIGIAREHLDRIFERFYRVDKARSRELGGTGLGLAIVKHQAQVFGGHVDVSSESGKGSTFTVLLPLAQQT